MEKVKYIYCPKGHKGVAEKSICDEDRYNDYDFFCKECEKGYPISEWESK
jgi:hypothetical protein